MKIAWLYRQPFRANPCSRLPKPMSRMIGRLVHGLGASDGCSRADSAPVAFRTSAKVAGSFNTQLAPFRFDGPNRLQRSRPALWGKPAGRRGVGARDDSARVDLIYFWGWGSKSSHDGDAPIGGAGKRQTDQGIRLVNSLELRQDRSCSVYRAPIKADRTDVANNPLGIRTPA